MVSSTIALLDYVKGLEKKDSRQRGQQIIAILQELGIKPKIQRFPYPKINNICVDFSTNPESKELLLSAHYDVVKESPGANDNASGVAVLLGLCQYLKKEPAPVRIVFFDREEAWLRTPLLRLGLLGSLYYVIRNSLRNISTVYNLELVGKGDYLSIWPVKGSEKELLSTKEIAGVAEGLRIPYRTVHIPWFMLSSDHLSFRLKGMANALSLSLLPASQVPVWEGILARMSPAKMIFRKRPKLPLPLSLTHSSLDSSLNVNENSLQLMLSLLQNLMNAHNYEVKGVDS